MRNSGPLAKWQNEDGYRVGKYALDRQRALKVDFQHHVRALLHPLRDRLARSPVAVTVHFGPFDKSVRLDHRVERTRSDKKVFPPVLFLAARRSGGVRDRRFDR